MILSTGKATLVKEVAKGLQDKYQASGVKSNEGDARSLVAVCVELSGARNADASGQINKYNYSSLVPFQCAAEVHIVFETGAHETVAVR